MKRPIVSKKSLDLQSNHFLRRSPGYPLGVSLGELDYLRGHKDDFYGDLLRDEYTLLTNAGGTGALLNGAHGGVYQLFVPNAAGAYARLFLGDGAGGFSTVGMPAGDETVMIARVRLNALNAAQGTIGATRQGTNNRVLGGYIPSLSPNWAIWARDNAGASSWTASTIAVVANAWHWLVLIINSTELILWVNGALACTHTTNLPINWLEPYWQVVRETGLMSFFLDYVAVIPRNL